MVPANVTVEDGVPVLKGLVPKLTVVPAGFPLEVRVIGLLNPPVNVAVKVVCMEAAAGQAEITGPGELKVKPPEAVMVKSVLEISKKIFPTASTFILAVVEVPAGMVTAADPSLGVLAANTLGKVCPPSVDSVILTLAQLTGAKVVLFTSQVIV